ncbi:type II and III secretion system protein family protein [Pelodictyon phaeoclathratiforme]|nr:pilus assembly protein N-terminal domain-containing protein [Pelodictyon phaeoclathratiforme]
MNLTCLIRFACRMSALVALLVGTVPMATMASPEPVRRRDDSYVTVVSEMTAPSIYLVPLGESRVYRFAQPIKRVAMGDPKVADYIMLNRFEVYLLGKKMGSTNLAVWDQNGNLTSSPVQVSRGTTALQALLKVLFPKENDIHLLALGPALVLSGSVSDALVAESVARLVRSYFGGSVSSGTPESALVGTDSKPFTGIIEEMSKDVVFSKTESHSKETTTHGGESDSTRGVVNLLKVRDSQQVRLEVCIAQVSRTFIESLGISFFKTSGDIQGSTLLSGFVSNATLNNLLLGRLGQANGIKMVADRKPSLFKVLAEPTIVTMSGKEGFFLVGGKIYVPVRVIDYSPINLQEYDKYYISYKEYLYGVGLRFMPVVLDAGRISLKVVSEVSEPDTESATSGTKANLPLFKISTVSTNVQMNEGENLVIGGLKLDNFANAIDSVPLLSEIPILGALFRDTKKNAEKTELMVIIRPTLVKGSATMPELPTDRVIPPTRKELFLDGKLEGSPLK